ncbi:MAG: hypothetical protein B0W54_03040 [Cellvibrio sp. 79]|nr:MAG: hypothetical protein B0W54_03040 [Cellvibrio sp. 79]
MRILFAFLLLLPLTAAADICKTIKPIDTTKITAKDDVREITFIAVDLKSRDCHVINKNGLTVRHGPYSTFKIPHTFIALETGAVKSVDERIEWDQVRYPAQSFWPDTWKQDQSLATAFKRSAVWYYQALVPRIKPKQYKKWLAKFHYGNQTFTPGSDQFWLNSEIKISAEEQVGFIVCLLKKRCGVKPETLSLFESIALQETKNNFSLYAKTGTGPLDPNNFNGAFEGWYVGYVKDKQGNALTAFAIYMQGDSFSALQNYRKELSFQLLVNLGFWSK